MHNPEEKAMILAYINCKMLIANLDICVHEIKIKGGPYGQLSDKLQKLQGAAKNVYGKIEKNINDLSEINKVEEAMEKILDDMWEVRVGN
jgi:hypothetical protein